MATTATTAESRGLPQFMRQHPLTAYFILSYLFSWIMVIPFILMEWHVISGTWPTLGFVAKPFIGPALAAYLMTRLLDGKEGVRHLWRSVIQWCESWKWYVFILLIFPVFFFLGIALMPGALASFTGLTTKFLISYPINFIVIFFFGGPLGEEIGWRGFALPRLQAQYSGQRWGILKASLILGLVWTFWHLPDFLTSAQHGGPDFGLRPFLYNLPIFTLLVMGLTFIFTWVYNRTHNSVFMAILLHASVNTLGYFVPLFPAPAIQDSDLAMALGWGILAVAILVLTRGQLGYQEKKA